MLPPWGRVHVLQTPENTRMVPFYFRPQAQLQLPQLPPQVLDWGQPMHLAPFFFAL